MLKSLKEIKYTFTERNLRGCDDHQLIKGMLAEGQAQHIGYVEMMGEAPRNLGVEGIRPFIVHAPQSCDIALSFDYRAEQSGPVAQFIRLLTYMANQCDFASQAVTEKVDHNGERTERIFLAAPLAYAVYGSLQYILQQKLNEATDRAEDDNGDKLSHREIAAYYRPRLTPTQYSEAVLSALQNGLYEFCSGHPRLGSFNRKNMVPHAPDFGYTVVAEALDLVTHIDMNLGIFDVLHTPVRSDDYISGNRPHWFDRESAHTPLRWEPKRLARTTHVVMEMLIRHEQDGLVSPETAANFKRNLPLIDDFIKQIREIEGLSERTEIIGAVLAADATQVSHSMRSGETVKTLVVKATQMGLLATVTAARRMEEDPNETTHRYLMSGCSVSTYQLALPPMKNKNGNDLRYDKATRNGFFNRLEQVIDHKKNVSDAVAIGHGGYIGSTTVHMPLPAPLVEMKALRSLTGADSAMLQKEVTEWCRDRVNATIAPTTRGQGRRIDLS